MSNPSASLYVGDLQREVTEPMIHDVFRAIGPIQSIRLCRDAFTKISLGYAYVNFFQTEDAERALEALNYTPINGHPVRIMWCHRDPSIRRSGVGNVFIKNLHSDIDNKSLYDTFSVFGAILSCKVAIDETGKSRGYGFVHFETQEAADNAIATVNNKLLLGQKVEVVMWKSQRERVKQNVENFTNLYVKSFPTSWTEDNLRELFAPFGNVTSCVVRRGENGESKGFGFVNFEDTQAAKAAAAELHGKEIEGTTLYVTRHQSRSEREQQKRSEYLQIAKQNQGVNLYVKNLDEDIDDDRLHQEFSQFGTITSHKIMRDEENVSRGFGFVCFSSPEEATRAVMEMNGRMIGSKPLYVAIAQKKEVRREQLAMQRQHRQHMSQMMSGGMHPQGMPSAPPNMFGPPGVFYPQGPMPPTSQFGYMPPGPMMRPRWVQGPAPDGFQQPHVAGYMPQAGQPGPQQAQQGAQSGRVGGARLRRGGGAGNQGGQPRGSRGGYKLSQNTRNRDQVVPQQGVPQGMAPAGFAGMPNMMVGMPQAGPTEQDLPSILASSSPEERRLILGERLYPLVESACGARQDCAPKVTGMLLQIEPSEVLVLLESPPDLQAKVHEALQLIEYAQNQAVADATQGEAQ